MEEEEESRDEFNIRIRKQLIEWFGPFEEFAERLASSRDRPKYGLIRSRMKSRSSPYASLQMSQDASPSHIPVHVALQSMRNLVEEPPLSALPTEFPGFNKKVGPGASGSNNGVEKNGKRRKMSSDEEGVGAKRKRENRIESSVTFSPDSGVHSTENDVESSSVEAILNIMTSLEEPRLSPIPETFLQEIKKSENDGNRGQKRSEKSQEKTPGESTKSKKSKFSTVFNDGDTSSASTSREPTPVVEKKKEEKKKEEEYSGKLKLKHLKSEKVQKLVELARKQGKLVRDEPRKEENGVHHQKEEKKDKESSVEKKEEKRRETPKPANKTVQQLVAKDISKLSPSVRSPKSISSSMNTPTPSILSRPSSSLSTHDPSSRTPKAMSNNEQKTPQTVKPARWTCQWEHAKLKAPQRLQIYDPTDPKVRSKAEFYHVLAKSFKGKADKSTDRVLRPLNYMASSVYFVMEAMTKNEKQQCSSMLRDTHDLLGVTVIKSIRETDDAITAHILPRVKIIGQIMLSVMQYHLYIYRSDTVLKSFQRLESRECSECIDIHPSTSTSSHSDTLNVPLPNKYVTSVAHSTAGPSTSAGSTPSSTITTASPWMQTLQSCPNQATMPQALYDSLRSHVKNVNSLVLASRYWEDSKNLARIVDGSFIKHFETICGKTIGMDMPFDHLAQFVLTAVASLEAEYMEEIKQPIRPTIDKMKTVLNVAMKTGTFYPSVDRQHRPSQSTPQLPPSTRTPTPSSLNLSSSK